MTSEKNEVSDVGGKPQIGQTHALKIMTTHSTEIDTLQRLKTLDTLGNCQRPVFSLGVSQHMHKITNLIRKQTKMIRKISGNNLRNVFFK